MDKNNSAENNIIMSTENLSVGYGKKIVVDGVCITLERGRILTLIGPNGAGKSTLLKTISGELKKISGRVVLCHRDIDEIERIALAKKMSVVLTTRPKAELMTAFDIVAAGRYPYTGRLGILSEDDRVKIRDVMKTFDIEDISERYFNELSDGQRQRVLIARAVCQEPEVLILDEPTSYLDMKFKIDILGTLRRIVKERNIAVIMSLHEIELASLISDTICVVEGDRIGRIGTSEEVFEGNYIQRLYGVRDEEFDTLTGAMHFTGCKDKPKVFVIGGGGYGIPVYNRLIREGIPFAAGIISENDVEYKTCVAGASRVVSMPAFEIPSPDGSEVETAKGIIDECESAIVAVKQFGRTNDAARILADYARSKNKIQVKS